MLNFVLNQYYIKCKSLKTDPCCNIMVAQSDSKLEKCEQHSKYRKKKERKIRYTLEIHKRQGIISSKGSLTRQHQTFWQKMTVVTVVKKLSSRSLSTWHSQVNSSTSPPPSLERDIYRTLSVLFTLGIGKKKNVPNVFYQAELNKKKRNKEKEKKEWKGLNQS